MCLVLIKKSLIISMKLLIDQFFASFVCLSLHRALHGGTHVFKGLRVQIIKMNISNSKYQKFRLSWTWAISENVWRYNDKAERQLDLLQAPWFVFEKQTRTRDCIRKPTTWRGKVSSALSHAPFSSWSWWLNKSKITNDK